MRVRQLLPSYFHMAYLTSFGVFSISLTEILETFFYSLKVHFIGFESLYQGIYL